MQRARKLAALAVRLRPVHSSDVSAAPAFRTSVAFDAERVAGFHSFSQVSGPAAEQESASSGILFPREGPGVSYALNWALAAAGVIPTGDAHRNLKPEALLKRKGAAKPASKSGSKVLYSSSPDLSRAQYNKLFKEVSSHVSESTVYVHDGAVGSASQLDARVRSISDSPAGALALAQILTPTPTRSIASEGFPITLYTASTLPSPSFPDAVVVDAATSSVIVTGAAVGDEGAIKAALAAVAATDVFNKGALLLPGRSVVAKGGTVLLVGPTSLLASTDSVAATSLWADPAVILGSAGIARPFRTTADAPNLYKTPNAIGILTADSTGGLPPISVLTAPQAAYYFLAGYNGETFHPALLPSPSALKPLPLAKLFSQLVGATPVFLINTAAGSELSKLVSAMLQKTPPSQKKGNEEAGTALVAKFDEFMTAKFPELPDGIGR